jgi:hypothetical protein
MESGFPQFSASVKKGTLGVSLVSRILGEEFGWFFRKHHQEEDFGIDGQIEVVSEAGAVTGHVIGCPMFCSFEQLNNGQVPGKQKCAVGSDYHREAA